MKMYRRSVEYRKWTRRRWGRILFTICYTVCMWTYNNKFHYFVWLKCTNKKYGEKKRVRKMQFKNLVHIKNNAVRELTKTGYDRRNETRVKLKILIHFPYFCTFMIIFFYSHFFLMEQVFLIYYTISFIFSQLNSVR